MVNDIISGVSIALDKEFGNVYTIYVDDVKQDLDVPAFLVTALNPSQFNQIARRYKGMCQICVQYFAENIGNNTEAHCVGERLLGCLECIELIDKINLRGSEMHYEIEDSVLHFFVNYTVSLSSVTSQTNMDTANINTRTKRGV